MGNLFDSSQYPQSEPAVLTAGDRWAWKRTDLGNDYPPASYSLSYEAILEGSGATSFTITCSESGSDYLAEVAAATTVNYTPGNYRWQAFITRTADSERIRVGYGWWDVRPDYATSTADPRSHAKIVLDAIEAVLEGRAATDEMSLVHNGRRLDRTPIPELLQLRTYYRNEVAKEEAQAAIDAGQCGGSLVRVHFR